MESYTSPLDNPRLVPYGIPEYVQGIAPAANVAFTGTVAGGFYERLVTVFCRLVTDATVADRQVYLEYRDADGNRYGIAGAPVTQSASATNDYAFQGFVGQSDWPVDDTVLVTLPPILMLPTFSWRLVIDNGQAGDQLSRIRFVRERFYVGNPLALKDS